MIYKLLLAISRHLPPLPFFEDMVKFDFRKKGVNKGNEKYYSPSPYKPPSFLKKSPSIEHLIEEVPPPRYIEEPPFGHSRIRFSHLPGHIKTDFLSLERFNVPFRRPSTKTFDPMHPTTPLHSAVLNNLRYLNLHYSERLAHFITVAFLTRSHTLLYGPAGCGKTTSMRAAILTVLGQEYSPTDPEGNLFMQIDADSQMTPGRMFGGAVAHTDANTGITSQRINYEAGILNRKYVLIDEGLDAPIETLTGLKGVMLRKVHNEFKARTEMFSILTNSNPKAVVENALPDDREAIRALMERCLHFMVDLPDRKEDTFFTILTPMKDAPKNWVFYSPEELEKERKKVSEVSISEAMFSILACLATDSCSKNSQVSPRALSLLAIPILKATAYMAGRDHVTEDDLESLKYAGVFADTTLQNRFEQVNRRKQITQAREAMAAANTFIMEVETAPSPKAAKEPLKVWASRLQKVETFLKELHDLTVPETLYSELGNLKSALENIRDTAQKAALKFIQDQARTEK